MKLIKGLFIAKRFFMVSSMISIGISLLYIIVWIAYALNPQWSVLAQISKDAIFLSGVWFMVSCFASASYIFLWWVLEKNQ